MIVIKRRVELGPDRVLHVQLPEDVPTGTIEVLVVCDSEEHSRGTPEGKASPGAGQAGTRQALSENPVRSGTHEVRSRQDQPAVWIGPIRPRPASPEMRRAKFLAGLGLIKGSGETLDEFLAERREEDRRRDRALGL